MKNNLENKFKELLTDIEAPFDENAWSSFEKNKLNGTHSSSFGKWVLVGAAATAGIAFILNQFTQETPAQQPELSNYSVQKEETAPIEITENLENVINSEEMQTITKETSNVHKKAPEVVDNRKENSTKSIEHLNLVSNDDITQREEDNHTTHSIKEQEQIKNELTENTISATPEKNDIPSLFTTGIVSTTEVCMGDAINIVNPKESKGNVRFSINNQTFDLAPGKSMDVVLSASTQLLFLDESNEVLEKQPIKVHPLPSANIYYEANVYKQGLPVVHLKTIGSFKTIEWSYGDQFIGREHKVDFHLFEKGNHEVSLKLTDENNCSNVINERIEIKENYNLMAMSAFRPNGYDHRNKLFMPYALTQRDVPFVLQIIDPRDNGVVYTTKNSSEGWDGIDQRTGKMSPRETLYIWKVNLEAPIEGESSVYAGTIMHH